MNSKQLKYVLKLAQTRNFSQAAQHFNMSQPAFSKQIIGLENEIKIKLFERGTNPLTLTPAGEFFIEKARKMVFEEDVLLKTIEKYRSGKKGKLVIGAVPFRSSYMLPPLITEIKKKFPELEIELREYGLAILKKELLEGEYDFAIMNLPVSEPEFETIPLETDRLMLAVPKALCHLVENREKSVIDDCSMAKALPFVTVGKEQEMRKLFDLLCAKANFEPDIYATVTGVATAWEIVKSGASATIIPGQFADVKEEHSEVKLFEIKNTPYKRQPAVVLRRGQFISEYAKYAIDVLTNR